MIDRASERIESIHAPDPCPLCDSALAQVIEVISYQAVWRHLEGDFGVHFTANVKDEHTPGKFATLVECTSCGLHYFTPIVAGSSDFYRELMKGAQYEEDRWEFGMVASTLAPGVTIIDLGSGSGAFLRSLGNRAARRVAIDHNVDVAQELCQQEIEFRSEIASLAAEQLETFDAVCAFQLLEHLPNIAEVIEPARACLRPGGSLFLSVPNRERTRRPGFEPLDCPPHHVSRWARPQFEVLARRFDLQLHRVQTQPPTSSTISELQERAFESRLRVMLGSHARLGARVLRKITLSRRAYARAVRSGRYARDGIFGHTMLAELRRPT